MPLHPQSSLRSSPLPWPVRTPRRRRRLHRPIIAAHALRAAAIAPNVLEPLERRVLLSTAVTTYHDDLASTGQNLTETTLTPLNVNSSSFGRLFKTNVDGQVYAQPLYVPNQNITTGALQGVHNV